MANGTYGTRKPANINISEDVEVFYNYRATRGVAAGEWEPLEPNSVLTKASFSGGTLCGMYNLRLPLEKFGNKGIYTIYIRPKEITGVTIVDVGNLTGNYSNIRGIVLNIPEGLNGFTGLTGYRVEYVDIETGERMDDYRIITSSNKCEPVSQNATVGSAMQKSVSYRLNDSSYLLFCTVTPSTPMSFNNNTLPFIGKTGQSIILSNTKFNPVMMEVEMVSHDADTISTMLEGSQLRDLDHGIITTFDSEGNIYHQAAYGNITNPDTGMNVDFKIKYDDMFIKTEQDNLDEIKRQVINGERL